MSWKDDAREQHEELLAEVRGARDDLRRRDARISQVVDEPFPQGDLSRFSGLALSVKLCRDYENGRTLLQMLKPVPRVHEGRVIRSGQHGLHVRCLCGGELDVPLHLEPCPGGCGRWYVGDESGVWAALLPEQEPDEAAAA